MEKRPRILLVDDDEVVRTKFSLYLEEAGISAVPLGTGIEALNQIEKGAFELVLLDIMMPDLDGFKTAKAIRTSPAGEHTPVIFLTALEDPRDLLKAYQSGAVDFVRKTCSKEELVIRVKTHLDLRTSRLALEEANQRLMDEIDQKKKIEEQLLAAYNEMENLAKTDPLTRLENRRRGMELLKEEDSRSSRGGKAYCLVMADLDNFKEFNSLHGNDAGDELLEKLSALLRSNLRTHDRVIRWGGEEFLFVLVESDRKTGMDAAEKLRKLIQDQSFTVLGKKVQVTMTFGVSDSAAFPGFDQALKKADEALLKGKLGGKNVVVGA